MNEIVDYHGFSDWREHTLENENPPFCIGFELEVENTQRNHDNNDLARFVKNTYPVICSRDGSIDYGFEIVSHPLSYNYIVENQDKLKYMLEQLSNKGCESHNPGTCGLHFHVTHPHDDDIIDRIILIMETYKQELITFSRRTSGQIESWCKFLSDVTQDGDCKSLYFIKKNKETSSRYMALNLTNYNTIEFRLFRGTLNFDTFMASVELVNNIVTLCSNLDIPVEEITWDRLTETQYAHTYCSMRNIRSTIIPHSDDEKYIELEKKTQKFKKKALKEFEGVKQLALKHIGILSSGIKIDMNIADELYRLRSKIKELEEIMQSLNSLIYMCNREDTTMDIIKDKIRTTLVYCSYGNYQDIKEKLENLLEESE
jgi:hypothetical protein